MYRTCKSAPYTQNSGRGIYVYTIECPSPPPPGRGGEGGELPSPGTRALYKSELYMAKAVLAKSVSRPGRALDVPCTDHGVRLEGLVMHWTYPSIPAPLACHAMSTWSHGVWY